MSYIQRVPWCPWCRYGVHHGNAIAYNAAPHNVYCRAVIECIVVPCSVYRGAAWRVSWYHYSVHLGAVITCIAALWRCGSWRRYSVHRDGGMAFIVAPLFYVLSCRAACIAAPCDVYRGVAMAFIVAPCSVSRGVAIACVVASLACVAWRRKKHERTRAYTSTHTSTHTRTHTRTYTQTQTETQRHIETERQRDKHANMHTITNTYIHTHTEEHR